MSLIVHDRYSYGFIRGTALSVMIKSLNSYFIKRSGYWRQSSGICAAAGWASRQGEESFETAAQEVSESEQGIGESENESREAFWSCRSPVIQTQKAERYIRCYNGLAVLRAGLAELHLQEVSGDTKPPWPVEDSRRLQHGQRLHRDTVRVRNWKLCHHRSYPKRSQAGPSQPSASPASSNPGKLKLILYTYLLNLVQVAKIPFAPSADRQEA